MPMTWSADKVDSEVARHNPIRDDLSDAVRSGEASELISRILDIDYRTAVDPLSGKVPSADQAPRGHGRPRRPGPLGSLRAWTAARPRLAIGVAALLLVGAAGGTFSALRGGGLGGPVTTPWQPAHVLGVPASAHERAGTWRLVDALLTGTWLQNDYGPPPGFFSCSPDGTCFVLAGKYASASAAAPLSESLYVTTNEGATWSVLALPSGLLSTTPLECSGAQWCATGGTYNGQPALVVTRDGGHSFTIDPLPAGVGTLQSLSCPSAGACLGLVAVGNAPPTDATLVVTDDGGSTIHDEPILAGDSMTDLVCSSITDCTVVGSTSASATDLVPVGVSAVTTDQGRNWTKGAVPAGFGIDTRMSSLACADAQHCFVTGAIPIPNQNPPQCASTSGSNNFKPTTPASSTALPKMSPQVAAISKVEAQVASTAVAKNDAASHDFGCTNEPYTNVGDIATSSDGGLTWTPEMLPTNVPSPRFSGISCPTATECWAAGTELIAETAGKSTDMSSPVLIGTTDGGTTWSKVVFSVPSTAPNATGQSYLSMGSVTCPTTSVCLARGAAAQNAPYAPVYSLVVPGG